MCKIKNYENNTVMAHGLNSMIKSEIVECNNKPGDQQKQQRTNKMGSRRIFPPQFKLQVLDSYRNDNDCKGNQRATARKYGIHRRQIQKWLQIEQNLRLVVANNNSKIISNDVKSSRQIVAYNSKSPTHTNIPVLFQHSSSSNSSSTSLSLLKSQNASIKNTTNSNFKNDVRDYASATQNSTYMQQYMYHTYHYYPKYEDYPIDLSIPNADRKVPIENEHKNGNEHTNSQQLSPVSSTTSSNLCKWEWKNLSENGDDTDDDKPHLTDISNSNTEAWDLSCRKRKNQFDDETGLSPPKSIKLFKPYLLDVDEEDNDSVIEKKDKEKYPIIWSYHNNSYYDYYDYPCMYPPSPPANQATYWASPQASPVSGYDSSTSISSIYSENNVELLS